VPLIPKGSVPEQAEEEDQGGLDDPGPPGKGHSASGSTDISLIILGQYIIILWTVVHHRQLKMMKLFTGGLIYNGF